MPKGVIRASAAVGRLLREKRQSLGLSLREVSERQAEAGELIPPSTLARIEQGKLDPGVRRLHRLLRQFRIAAQAVADLIDLEDLAIAVPTGVGLETLYREVTEGWKRGHMPRGMD